MVEFSPVQILKQNESNATYLSIGSQPLTLLTIPTTHILHPLLVEDVLAADIAGDVAADRVTEAGGTVRVKLSSVVAVFLPLSSAR